MTPLFSVPIDHRHRPTSRESRPMPAALRQGYPPRPSIWQRLANAARRTWKKVLERRRLKRDEEYLASMPEHLLRDIGLVRLETGRLGRRNPLR